MITLFTTAKPFQGHIDVIQRNAIRSWTLLRPECEIILFGDDEGAAEIAGEFGLRHIPDVARNEHGTLLLSGMFDTAQRIASHSILCYINADIILMSYFMQAVEQVVCHKHRFLMVGQRWDVNLENPWDFSQPDWEIRMREHVHNRGSLHPPCGIDYFLFPHGLWGDIPPFAIARTVFDNWLIYAARSRGAAVIDATRVVMAVHQNHELKLWVRGGAEAKQNLEMAGGFTRIFTVQDATHLLTPQGLKRVSLIIRIKRIRKYLDRYFGTLPIFHPRVRLWARIARALLFPCSAMRAFRRRVCQFISPNYHKRPK